MAALYRRHGTIVGHNVAAALSAKKAASHMEDRPFAFGSDPGER